MDLDAYLVDLNLANLSPERISVRISKLIDAIQSPSGRADFEALSRAGLMEHNARTLDMRGEDGTVKVGHRAEVRVAGELLMLEVLPGRIEVRREGEKLQGRLLPGPRDMNATGYWQEAVFKRISASSLSDGAKAGLIECLKKMSDCGWEDRVLSERERFVFGLRELLHLCSREQPAPVETTTIPPLHYAILKELAKAHPEQIEITDLAVNLNQSRTATSGAVKDLEKMGLVSRPWGERSGIGITESGVKKLRPEDVPERLRH